MMNSAPNSPNMTRAADEIAAENLLLRKSPRRSIGCDVVRSQATKTARTASPASPAVRTGADDQPRSGASMIDHSSSPSPVIESTAPATSGPSTAGFFESGTSGMAHATPTAAIGTLIRNTDPHQKCVSNRPPTIGPSAMPTPIVPAHRLIARCRSPPSRNMSVMIDSVEGIISAAPMPILARAAISTPTEPEKAAHAEPTAKAARPARNVRLRPTRSARLPATSTSPAKTIMYASTIHCSWLELACKSRTNVGSATLRTVLSRFNTRMASCALFSSAACSAICSSAQVHHQQRHAQDSESQPAPRW